MSVLKRQKNVIFFVVGQPLFFLVIRVDFELSRSIGSLRSNSHMIDLNIDLDKKSGQEFSRLGHWPMFIDIVIEFPITCSFFFFVLISGVWLSSTYSFLIILGFDRVNLIRYGFTSFFLSSWIYLLCLESILVVKQG
jgi:hypothetical protein